jgi:hypothetical protein
MLVSLLNIFQAHMAVIKEKQRKVTPGQHMKITNDWNYDISHTPPSLLGLCFQFQALDFFFT